eukprot:11872589-Ditylum_brightwellii.AAC.1
MELMRTASGCIVLESGNMTKIQETGLGFTIGSFSLNIVLLGNSSATPKDTFLQTKPGGVNVEDMSNTATYSVSDLALLSVGVTIFNIIL